MIAKRIAQCLATGAAGAAFLAGTAGGAGASTGGCMTARFTCGDETQARADSAMGLGWIAPVARPGAKVTAGRDLASSPGTDWKVIADGPTVAFEDAPGGKPSGLYLGIGGKSTVVLETFAAGWAVHWEAEARGQGTVYVNDLTGEAIAAPKLGTVLRTVPVRRGGQYRFLGHIAGS